MEAASSIAHQEKEKDPAPAESFNGAQDEARTRFPPPAKHSIAGIRYLICKNPAHAPDFGGGSEFDCPSKKRRDPTSVESLKERKTRLELASLLREKRCFSRNPVPHLQKFGARAGFWWRQRVRLPVKKKKRTQPQLSPFMERKTRLELTSLLREKRCFSRNPVPHLQKSGARAGFWWRHRVRLPVKKRKGPNLS